MTVAEVRLYPGSDVSLRFLSGAGLEECAFLPGYKPSAATDERAGYGIDRIDHIVGNVPDLLQVRACVGA